MNQTTQNHLRVLRIIEGNPEITQRELAQKLNVSLGKVNYCLKALIQKGWVKVNNFKTSNNKSAYAYLLTAKGIERKAKITTRYLKSRIDEYETLRKEIEILRREVGAQQGMDT